MTPNIAQGANCAIETAASLANRLSRADKHPNSNIDLESWSHSRRRMVQLFYWASRILVCVEGSIFLVADQVAGMVYWPFSRRACYGYNCGCFAVYRANGVSGYAGGRACFWWFYWRVCRRVLYGSRDIPCVCVMVCMLAL